MRLKSLLTGPERAPFTALLLAIGAAVITLLTGPSESTAWVVIGLVPGLALLPLLPQASRQSSPMALVAIVLASLTFWVASAPLLLLTHLGISRTTLLLLTIGLAAVCVPLAVRYGDSDIRRGADLGDLIGLVATVGAGVWITRSFRSDPPSGSDWGHYWGYADAIVKSGSLDSINQWWMGGGLPFKDYPGYPSGLAVWLSLAGQTASETPGAIVLLSILLGVMGWFTVRCWWRWEAAAVAGAAMALLPTSIEAILWSGIGTVASLVFALPLSAAATALLNAHGREKRKVQIAAAGLAVAAGLIHPLTLLIVGGGLAVVLVATVVIRRGAGILTLAETALLAVLIGAAGFLNFSDRLSQDGGLQSNAAVNLGRTLNWTKVLGSGLMPGLLVGAGIAGLLLSTTDTKRRNLALSGLSILGVAFVYANLWRFSIGGEYRRMTYIMSPILAIGLGGLVASYRSSSRVAVPLAALSMVGGMALWVQALPGNMSPYYRSISTHDAAAIAKLGSLTAPSESIVTDSCLSFPSGYFANAKVYAGLKPQLIGPNSEANPARLARTVFAGGKAGKKAQAELNPRWSVINPDCHSSVEIAGNRTVPPGFVEVYASPTLVVGYRDNTKQR